MNKIEIEFDVEKELEMKYGIVEKYLSRYGEKTPFKAIVKNGEFVTIVGRRYKVVPNEGFEILCARIADVLNYDYTIDRNGWRSYVDIAGNDFGVMCGNSIDGSMGLWADAVVHFDDFSAYMTGVKTGYNTVYAKHTTGIENILRTFQDVVVGLIEISQEYKDWVFGLNKIPINDMTEFLDMMDGELPKKYLKDVRVVLNHGNCNLYNVYKLVAERIYKNNKVEVRTKRQLFKQLNEFVMTYIELVR